METAMYKSPPPRARRRTAPIRDASRQSKLFILARSAAYALIALAAGCTGEISTPSTSQPGSTPGDTATGVASGGGEVTELGSGGAPGLGNGGTLSAGTVTGGGATGGAAMVESAAGTTAVASAGSSGMDEESVQIQSSNCDVNPNVVIQPKRVLRLTFNQQANSLRSLFGATLADQIVSAYDIPDPLQRTFPPLLSPREGINISATAWQLGDNIAQEVARHVFDNFATVTACTDSPTAECGQQYLSALAERAYRRPLTADELARLTSVYDAARSATGATVQEGVQYGVYAVLSAPAYLYRTEFGNDSAVEGPLSQYEQASALSFFLTDAPPDQALLDAAAAGTLGTPAEIDAQVVRLLATPEARTNLESAMLAYFKLPALPTIIINSDIAAYSPAHASSMLTEAELFLQNILWGSEHLNELLLSRSTQLNTTLADIYGVPAPDGATATEFRPTTLPDTRSGLLTQAGFLTARTRPKGESVVGRGLAVNSAFLCAQNPSFPDALATIVDDVTAMLEGQTEREKADFRAGDVQCTGCHSAFDAFGLVLENFDAIGRHRTLDEEGRPVDTAVTLPARVGGASVSDAVALAQQLAGTGQFAACVANNLLGYALAETGPLVTDCATTSIAEQLATTGGSFSELLRQVAISATLTNRLAGVQRP